MYKVFLKYYFGLKARQEERDMDSNGQRLAKKLLDSLYALHTFFDTLIKDDTASPILLARELVENYELTETQTEDMKHIALRAHRARSVVAYLEQYFKLNGEGLFQRPRGVAMLSYDGRNTTAEISARSYNIAVGFEKVRWRHKGKEGFQENPPPSIDFMNISFDKTEERLRTGKRVNFGQIYFWHPNFKEFHRMEKKRHRDYLSQFSAETRLAYAINGKRLHKTNAELYEDARIEYGRLVAHEIRHVTDSIIRRSSYPQFVETQAYLYGHNSSRGVRLDAKRCKRWGIRYIAKDEDAQEKLESQIDRLIDGASIEDCRAYSYLFSTQDSSVIPYCLDLLIDYLGKGEVNRDAR
jgi:hypothetical protein